VFGLRVTETILDDALAVYGGEDVCSFMVNGSAKAVPVQMQVAAAAVKSFFMVGLLGGGCNRR
jgi:hypothetical protein